MKCENQMQLTFPSKSVNEGFARAAVAVVLQPSWIRPWMNWGILKRLFQRR